MPTPLFMATLGWGTTGWGPWSAVVGPVTTSASTGPTDSVLPGLLVALSVTGANGNFVADWKKPTTGNLTIDDHAIEYAENPGFTINPVKSQGWGPATHQQSTLPNKTFYFRIAAHNQSGLDSHASIVGLGYEKGWGPWTNYGAPNAVSSGPAPGTPGGTPADSVIPGAVLGLSVTGGNGKFIAKWLDPATGNKTIDDTAVSWSISPSFSPEAANSPAVGWGPRNLLDSESPNCTFYFRVAVHNQSNQLSDSSTVSSLGATGWGPWTIFGGAVNSGPLQSDAGGGATENLCPNGSFEFDTDGDAIPDDCTYPFAGTIPVVNAGRSALISYNGNYSFRLPPGANSAVALGGFAVSPGERLSISARLYTGAISGVYSVYIRAYFDTGSTRQFTTWMATENIASGLQPVPGWQLYEGQVTVPANCHWCRIVVQNDTGSIDHYYDDIVVLRTTEANDVRDNAIPPKKFTGAAQTDFVETFDTPLGEQWAVTTTGPGAGSVPQMIYTANGVDGGKALEIYGTGWALANMRIPFDPRKLYRMTARARVKIVTDAAKARYFAGISCWNQSGAYIDTIWTTANSINTVYRLGCECLGMRRPAGSRESAQRFSLPLIHRIHRRFQRAPSGFLRHSC